jgi:hypothetical protein
VSNRLDLSTQIDGIDLSFCCRFYFTFLPAVLELWTPGPTVQQRVRAFISSLRTSLLVSNPLDLSVQIDGIDLSFCCIFYFAFSPAVLELYTPGPTVRQRVRAFISPLRTSLLVCKRFILVVKINGIDLTLCCRFYFRFFTFLTPCTASNTQQRLMAFVNALQTPFLIRN